MVGRICGTGFAVPEKIVTNDDLSKVMDTSDEWIRERTGIVTRHIAVDETSSTMSIEAAKMALKNSGLEAEEIGMIIVSTVTPDLAVPGLACKIQDSLKAVNAFCLDMNAACVGFLMAMNMAQNAIMAGSCKNALIVGVETLSSLVDWTDRTTAPLFGDGAGACVLKGEEGGNYSQVMFTDGARGDYLFCETRRQNKWKEKEAEKLTYLKMGGQDVFRFATREVPNSIKAVLEKANLSVEDIDYFVLHQANKRILETISRRLKVPMEKIPMNINKYGNTSSASIPLLLSDMDREGKLKKGMKLIVSGFGGGLTWGASVVEI